MKTLANCLLLTTVVCTSTAFLVIPDYIPGSIPKPFLPQGHQQKPIMSGPDSSHPSPKEKQDVSVGDLSISDVIGKERVINIFAGFTRKICVCPSFTYLLML